MGLELPLSKGFDSPDGDSSLRLSPSHRTLLHVGIEARELLDRYISPDTESSLLGPLRSDLTDLNALIDFPFADPNRLEQALTHRSSPCRDTRGPAFGFLGTAALEFVVREDLYVRYPFESEGELARRRNRILAAKSLAKLSDSTGLSRFIRVDPYQPREEVVSSVRVRAGAVQRVVGLMAFEKGVVAAAADIKRFLGEELLSSGFDFNSTTDVFRLLKRLGYHQLKVVFQRPEGPGQRRSFPCLLVTQDGEVLAQASGSSKKEAKKKFPSLCSRSLLVVR